MRLKNLALRGSLDLVPQSESGFGELMDKGVVDAYHYMQNLDTKLFASNLYWPDRHWSFVMVPDAQHGFDFVSNDAVDIDKRAGSTVFLHLLSKNTER
jgi:hypothetical protein